MLTIITFTRQVKLTAEFKYFNNSKNNKAIDLKYSDIDKNIPDTSENSKKI